MRFSEVTTLQSLWREITQIGRELDDVLIHGHWSCLDFEDAVVSLDWRGAAKILRQRNDRILKVKKHKKEAEVIQRKLRRWLK